MGSFSIFHVAILVAIFGIPIWLIVRARRKAAKSPPAGMVGPVGFGGWLVLLAFGQTLGPVFTLGEIRNSWTSPLDTGAAIEVGLMGAFLVLQLFTAVAMYRRKKYFRKLFAVQS